MKVESYKTVSERYPVPLLKWLVMGFMKKMKKIEMERVIKEAERQLRTWLGQ